MKDTPSCRRRSGNAASSSPATASAVTTEAVRGRVSAVARSAQEAGGGAGAPRGALGHSAAGPRTASTAGTSVTATTSPISTVRANPGPSPRNSAERATRSAAVPAATVSPATATIGAVRAVARSTAWREGAPAASSPRRLDRKNTL